MRDFSGWKYCKSADGVNVGAVSTDPNAPHESRLLTDIELAAWIQAGGILLPAQSTAEVMAEIWQRIKAKRTAVELGGVKVGTKWYHTDDASRIKYLGLFKLAEQALAAGSVGTTVLQYGGVDIKWKTMDGTFINMTVQRAQDVYFAVFGLDMAAFAAAETHKTAMEAAADPAAYDFSAGWPASYI